MQGITYDASSNLYWYTGDSKYSAT
ncbi:hypothetical protein ACV56Z_06315 [Staphylococcus aureus]